jgi:uncharacterized protein YkwD
MIRLPKTWLLACPLVLAVSGCADAPQRATVTSSSGVPEVGRLTNEARSARGLPPLLTSTALTDAAVSQAQYTAASGRLTHRSAGGSTVMDRIKARGFDACLAAENLAAGQSDAAEVTAGWLTSPGHRSNMLIPRATHYGAGRAVTVEGMPYWVMVLAGQC